MSVAWQADEAVGEVWWQSPQVWRQVAYHALLPALVAWLPVLWPIPALKAAGAAAEPKPVWAIWPLFALVGWLWSRQVIGAAADDLARRLDADQVLPALGNALLRWVYPLVVIFSIVIPLRYGAIYRHREAQTFHLTSRPALDAIAAAVHEHGPVWAKENPAGKAFVPDDARITGAVFGGPFAAGEGGAIAKLVTDEAGRWWYIQDRPESSGPSLKAWLKQVVGRTGLADAQGWINERGLVWVPPGVTAPETTVWGMPVRRLIAVGDGWNWYHAGEPAELHD